MSVRIILEILYLYAGRGTNYIMMKPYCSFKVYFDVLVILMLNISYGIISTISNDQYALHDKEDATLYVSMLFIIINN